MSSNHGQPKRRRASIAHLRRRHSSGHACASTRPRQDAVVVFACRERTGKNRAAYRASGASAVRMSARFPSVIWVSRGSVLCASACLAATFSRSVSANMLRRSRCQTCDGDTVCCTRCSLTSPQRRHSALQTDSALCEAFATFSSRRFAEVRAEDRDSLGTRRHEGSDDTGRAECGPHPPAWERARAQGRRRAPLLGLALSPPLSCFADVSRACGSVHAGSAALCTWDGCECTRFEAQSPLLSLLRSGCVRVGRPGVMR